MDITFKEVQDANAARCPEIFPEAIRWTGTEWALAVAGETGELCNNIKKANRGDLISIKKIMDEAADIVHYCTLLANHYQFDLGQAVVDKFNEVSERHNNPRRL